MGIVGSRVEPEYIGSRVASGRLKEITGPGRRTEWSSGGEAQMGENLGHHRGLLNLGVKLELKRVSNLIFGCLFISNLTSTPMG